MCAIFIFSSQTAAVSGKLSGGITHAIASLFVPDFKSMSQEHQTEIIESMHFYIRKAAHFSIYTALGFFSFLFAGTYKIKNTVRFTGVLLFCLFYASTDEIHQLFIDGRAGSIRDVCIDFCGAITGTLICCLLTSLISVIKQKKQK